MNYNPSMTGNWSFATIIRDIITMFRLLFDPKTPGWAKLLPIFAMLYFFSPIDLIPVPFLGLGMVDDLAVIVLLSRVAAQMASAANQNGDAQSGQGDQANQNAGNESHDGKTIDATWQVVDES